MIFVNSKIWGETVEQALNAVGDDKAWQDAIARGAREIARARYWHFDSTTNTLTLISTTSAKRYVITEKGHTCEATQKYGARCKHRVALRLLQRYSARLNAATVSTSTCTVINWDCHKGHEQVATQTQTIKPGTGQAETTKRAMVRTSMQGVAL